MSKPFINTIGRIGKIEAEYTPQGKFICKFSLAVDVGWGDKKSTNWYNCVAWEKTGERINQWCEKGTKLAIEGHLELREWTDKNEVKHLSPDITVSGFEVVAKGKKKEEAEEDEPSFMQD